jgi:NarL family two-component system response regulator LiaR
VTPSSDSATDSRHGVVREILIYGLCGGALIAALQLLELRFLLIDRSFQIYGAIVAVVFAGVGIWLGRKLTRTPTVIYQEVPADGPFEVDRKRLAELGITPRELEILGLIAEGLSNREIADRLFVSENTVKTHSGRLFDKLGAKRRTQAVQLGKAARLIP